MSRLTDIEFKIRKVRGQELYQIWIVGDYDFAKDTEKILFQHVCDSLVPIRGSKLEMEEHIKGLQEELAAVYQPNNQFFADLKRCADCALEESDIMDSRKRALAGILGRMEKLGHTGILLAIIDEYLYRRWYRVTSRG